MNYDHIDSPEVTDCELDAAADQWLRGFAVFFLGAMAFVMALVLAGYAMQGVGL